MLSEIIEYTAEKYEAKARKSMKTLGTYKPEFEKIIEVYAQLLEEYDDLTRKYKESGYEYAEQTQSGSKKAPIVTTLEALRKDILSYASQLGLTPQGLLKADDQAFAKKKASAIAEALKAVNG